METNKNRGRNNWLIVILITILVSCSSSELPHYGAYLKDGTKLIEINQFDDSPKEVEYSDIYKTTESQPTLIFWYPDSNLDYLELRSDAGDGVPIKFHTAPTEPDGALEISPAQPLPKDIYCLIQGGPFIILPPHWCFEVNGAATEHNSQDSKEDKGNETNNEMADPAEEYRKKIQNEGITLTGVGTVTYEDFKCSTNSSKVSIDIPPAEGTASTGIFTFTMETIGLGNEGCGFKYKDVKFGWPGGGTYDYITGHLVFQTCAAEDTGIANGETILEIATQRVKIEGSFECRYPNGSLPYIVDSFQVTK